MSESKSFVLKHYTLTHTERTLTGTALLCLQRELDKRIKQDRSHGSKRQSHLRKWEACADLLGKLGYHIDRDNETRGF